MCSRFRKHITTILLFCSILSHSCGNPNWKREEKDSPRREQEELGQETRRAQEERRARLDEGYRQEERRRQEEACHEQEARRARLDATHRRDEERRRQEEARRQEQEEVQVLVEQTMQSTSAVELTRGVVLEQCQGDLLCDHLEAIYGQSTLDQ